MDEVREKEIGDSLNIKIIYINLIFSLTSYFKKGIILRKIYFNSVIFIYYLLFLLLEWMK